jgi:hypothetical protein
VPAPRSLHGARWYNDADVPAGIGLNPRAGVVGPWSERLPHFRFDAPPSVGGDELQTEYFVARRHAVDALRAVRAMGDRISPHLHAADPHGRGGHLWSPRVQRGRSVSIGFTAQHPEQVHALMGDVGRSPTSRLARTGASCQFSGAVRGAVPRLPDALDLPGAATRRGSSRASSLTGRRFPAISDETIPQLFAPRGQFVLSEGYCFGTHVVTMAGRKMADPHRVELRTTALDAGRVVVTAHGAVARATSALLLDDLVKLLIDGVPVLLDVSGLQLEWAPAPEVFVAAVTSAGGWPYARLVLFGADAVTAERLRSCRVPEAVFLAGTLEQAEALVDGVRPNSAARHRPACDQSIQRPRVPRDTDDRWGLPNREETASVVAELVTNAVVHAGTGLRLRFVLDRNGLRVSVRDQLPATVTPGPGLRSVARLSRSWGVLHYADGKSVWANLPSGRTTRLAPAVTGTAAPAPHPVAVRAPRRRRFATADPEQAHAFLRTVYGPLTLHLADASDGFHLEYDGVATHRFAVSASGTPLPSSLFAPRTPWSPCTLAPVASG